MLTEQDCKAIERAVKERIMKRYDNTKSPLNGAIAEISVQAAIMVLQEYEKQKERD